MMTTFRTIATASTFVFASAALAQQPPPAPAAAPASAPAQAGCASMAPDRHDHAAERGTPGARSKGCPADKPQTGKKKMGHDHARTHKLM